MAVTKEAIVIVLDVGRPMHCGNDNSSVLEQAKQCINMIIQRKIFSESKDEIALILFGTVDTSNNLAKEYDSQYRNIKVIQEFQPASWELLEYVNDIQGSDLSSDFIDALVVAMDILYYKKKDEDVTGRIMFISNFGSNFSTHELNNICKAIKSKKMDLNIIENAMLTAINLLETISGKKFFTRRILFLSCFDENFCSDKVAKICEELNFYKIDLNIIGPIAYSTEEYKYDTQSQSSKAEKYVCHLLKQVNGESYSFSEALPALIYYQKKKVQALPWNATLDIGTNLNIPISVYTKVTESKPKSWKSAFAHKLSAKIERRVDYILNDENQTKVSKESIISAFKYGTTLVPYSDEDKMNMDYQSGEKGMKVLGFTKAENVQRYHYSGDKCMYVFGQKSRELSGVILAPFIQALYDTKMVAIVRYVYSPRSSPKIGFLSPKIKPDYECLVFILLPFMDDLRHFMFSSLDTKTPSEEELNAVDDLITSMDLNSPPEKEEEELLKPKHTVNPYLQRLYQCLQYKAFRPDKPLPEIPSHIKSLLTPPPDMILRAEPALKKVKSVFTFKETVTKKHPETENYLFPNGKRSEPVNNEDKGCEDFENDANLTVLDTVTDKITQVGSVNPIRDFQYLVSNMSYPFSETCQQMVDIVYRYLQDTSNLKLYYSKILSICKELRNASLKMDDASIYNSFMKNLQTKLLECDEDLWNKIRYEKIGLITKAELPSSLVSCNEAETYLSVACSQDNKDSVKVESPCDVDEDYDNLLDQL